MSTRAPAEAADESDYGEEFDLDDLDWSFDEVRPDHAPAVQNAQTSSAPASKKRSRSPSPELPSRRAKTGKAELRSMSQPGPTRPSAQHDVIPSARTTPGAKQDPTALRKPTSHPELNSSNKTNSKKNAKDDDDDDDDGFSDFDGFDDFDETQMIASSQIGASSQITGSSQVNKEENWNRQEKEPPKDYVIITPQPPARSEWVSFAHLRNLAKASREKIEDVLPPHGPQCKQCLALTNLRRTAMTNENGNGDRPFYGCPDGHFATWADLKECGRRKCFCGVGCRKFITKRGLVGWKCAGLDCEFEAWPNGRPDDWQYKVGPAWARRLFGARPPKTFERKSRW